MKVDFLAKVFMKVTKKSLYDFSYLCNELLGRYTANKIFLNQNERHCSRTQARVVDPVYPPS
jgi:hypothetical protein